MPDCLCCEINSSNSSSVFASYIKISICCKYDAVVTSFYEMFLCNIISQLYS